MLNYLQCYSIKVLDRKLAGMDRADVFQLVESSGHFVLSVNTLIFVSLVSKEGTVIGSNNTPSPSSYLLLMSTKIHIDKIE